MTIDRHPTPFPPPAGRLNRPSSHRRAGGDRAHSHASGVVGAAATTDPGAARGTISGGLILEGGLVLRGPMGELGLRACGRADLGEIGHCERQHFGENSGARVNCHAVDGPLDRR